MESTFKPLIGVRAKARKGYKYENQPTLFV